MGRAGRILGLAAVALAAVAAGGCGASGQQTATKSAGPRQLANGPLAAGWQGPTIRGAAARRARVAILMYHVIADAPADARYPGLWVPKRLFAEQMYVLHQAGFQAVTMRDVLRAWDMGAALPAKPIVVSFDDGNRTQVEGAGPMLQALGWPGLLNLEIDNVGRTGIKASAVAGLVDSGWEIGSHTVSHPDLTDVSDAQLHTELTASKADIRRLFGAEATVFCYPAGRYNAHVEAAVRAAGYQVALTEDPGAASPAGDRYALPRIRVDATESPQALAAAVIAAEAA
jgi:peptidoglycan/xylan/chitin deacetylase (PgdA/CDA1 family)